MVKADNIIFGIFALCAGPVGGVAFNQHAVRCIGGFGWPVPDQVAAQFRSRDIESGPRGRVETRLQYDFPFAEESPAVLVPFLIGVVNSEPHETGGPGCFQREKLFAEYRQCLNTQSFAELDSILRQQQRGQSNVLERIGGAEMIQRDTGYR